MKLNFYSAALAALLCASACRGDQTKSPDMISYEELRDDGVSLQVQERFPEMFQAAQDHYARAIDAHVDGDEEIASHHTKMALMIWRTAIAKSESEDTRTATSAAEERYNSSKKQLDEMTSRLAMAEKTVIQLEEIAKLKGQVASAEGSVEMQKQLAKTRELIQVATSMQAARHAPELYDKATVHLDEAMTALKAGKPSEASAAAKLAAKFAERAAAQAKPKYEAERGQLELAEARRALFEAASKVPGINRRMTEGAVVLTLHQMFAPGKVQIASQHFPTLIQIAELAKQFGKFGMVIEGHTDNRGSKSKNLSLSLARAQSVATFLSQQGIGPARITSAGKGSDAPIADNRSKAGRAENRRIEVLFIQSRNPS